MITNHLPHIFSICHQQAMDVTTLTHVIAMVMESASAVTYEESVWSQTHGPGAGLPSEGIVLNNMFHQNSISFMAQKWPLLVPINILVILSLTSSFHKLIAVAEADLGSKATKGKILDSELCTILALDWITPTMVSSSKAGKTDQFS